ncbi:MAG: hypothetical protein QOF15_3651, partial [Mycobacterium sp.]|nr:hypothetical protein [Mycobacterium sp.]
MAERIFPLTRGQRDIWLAHGTGSFGAKWQLGELLRIEGALDPGLVERAIVQAVRDAEPLRASFFEVDEQVLQTPLDYPDVALPRYDLTGSPDPVGDAHRLASSIQLELMSLDGPLFKFALFQTRVDEFYLFACCHHIAVDGIGLALVIHRIADAYSALVSGVEIPPSYFGSLNDLVESESEYEASADYLDDQAYWSQNLPPESEPRIRLALGEPDDEAPTPVQLDPSVVVGIQELSQALGIRRSSVITAACALLVRAFDAESPDLVLDFPVSRRVRPEAQWVPGMISGFVPLVLDASPDTAVARFCRLVDTRMREALAHQRFPVHAIESRTGLRGSGQASNRAVVNFIPISLKGHFGDAATTGTLTHAGPVEYGLVLFRDDDRLFLSTVGDGRYFPNCDVPELARLLERVLGAMFADPERSLSSVDALGEGERARLDGLGNRAALSRPTRRPVSIAALFASQAAATPHSVALTCGSRSISYGELEKASNRLAHLLAGEGVGSGHYVAVMLPRSAEAIAAILAVLKTGAAYVPMDPAVPAARLEFMLADAAPIAAITTADLATRLDGHGLLVIDVEDPAVDTQPSTPPPAPAPDDIAYLIYTSGTTGVPKGVAVTHRNVTQLMESLDPVPAGIWPLCHSLAFDVSVWEIFGALLRGG